VTLAADRLDAEGRARLDHGLLEGADQGAEQDPAVAQTNDRIGHELARPVIGDLAAALHPEDLDAAPA
jgi:hypothetical protein